MSFLFLLSVCLCLTLHKNYLYSFRAVLYPQEGICSQPLLTAIFLSRRAVLQSTNNELALVMTPSINGTLYHLSSLLWQTEKFTLKSVLCLLSITDLTITSWFFLNNFTTRRMKYLKPQKPKKHRGKMTTAEMNKIYYLRHSFTWS